MSAKVIPVSRAASNISFATAAALAPVESSKGEKSMIGTGDVLGVTTCCCSAACCVILAYSRLSKG